MFRFGRRIRRVIGYYPQSSRTIEGVVAVAHYPEKKLLYVLKDGQIDFTEYPGIEGVETGEELEDYGTYVSMYGSGYDPEENAYGSYMATSTDLWQIEIKDNAAIIHKSTGTPSTETVRRARILIRSRFRR